MAEWWGAEMWWFFVLLMYLDGDKPGRTARRIPPLQVPPGGFNEQEAVAAAQLLEVPLIDLLAAIVMCSERARSLPIAADHQQELQAIAASIHNRLRRYPSTFGTTPWAVVMAGKTRTGEPGGQFATSVVPQGDLLAFLLITAAGVSTEQARGETRQDVTNYHHHDGAEADRINAIWEGRGYVRVFPAATATFFAPGAQRARVMR